MDLEDGSRVGTQLKVVQVLPLIEAVPRPPVSEISTPMNEPQVVEEQEEPDV